MLRKIIKVNTLEQFVKYIFNGLFAYLLLNIFTYFFVKILILTPPVSYFLSQLIVFFINFFVAVKFIFSNSNQRKILLFLKFIGITIIFRFLEWISFVIIIELLHLPIFLSIFFSIVIILPLKFITTKYSFEKN